MSVDAGTAQVLLSSFGQFRAELLNPSKDSRSVNVDAPFGPQTDNVLVRQRKPKIPADSAPNDLAQEAVMLNQ